MIKSSPVYILAASLLLSGCATMGTQNVTSTGIDSDIKLINARITHSLEAMLIDECGRGTHPLTEVKERDPKTVDIEDLHDAISTVDHTLECRKDRYSDILKERETLVQTVRLTRPDVFDAADAEGKAAQVLQIPNLTEEIRQARQTTLKLEEALLRLRTEM